MKEEELINALKTHEKHIDDLLNKHISFNDFLNIYNYFYFTYALDGHEGDSEFQNLLRKFNDKIEFHRIICEDILFMLCGDEDSKSDEYKKAGRINSIEAIEKIKS
ncbi:hypothetical protein [Leptospira alexanderi]|uniref:hypothetical protein n=1 Tax=Leptospira alexanderi TaxID=100053 RepID=UPI00111598D6|nr:hypothetical protein [Leptospira alexanderi]